MLWSLKIQIGKITLLARPFCVIFFSDLYSWLKGEFNKLGIATNFSKDILKRAPDKYLSKEPLSESDHKKRYS